MKILLSSLVAFVFLSACGDGADEAEKDNEIQALQQEVEHLKEQLANGSAANDQGNETDSNNKTKAEELDNQKENGILFTFGSEFVCDGFNVKIGNTEDIVWLSDRDDNDVLGIPVTLSNLGEETGKLNSARYKFFGPDGTQIDEPFGFRDYDIWSQGDMRQDASQQGYFVMEYVGDGEYVIEFSERGSDTIEVVLEITK